LATYDGVVEWVGGRVDAPTTLDNLGQPWTTLDAPTLAKQEWAVQWHPRELWTHITRTHLGKIGVGGRVPPPSTLDAPTL
jgi:hypothetical protein